MKMSNYIADEKSIFAYRKLIELVGSNPISFFINFSSEKKIFGSMCIYDSSFIELLFLICNFLFIDIEDDYLAVKITATKVIHPYDEDTTLKGGFSYFTDYYVTEKYKEYEFYSHFDDKLAKIIEDFPEISKTYESTNTLLFVRLVNLLYGIYNLDPSISNTFFYESGIGITITKGAKFNTILKDGAFAKNLELPVKAFTRSLYGVYGDHLLSFGKQVEFVKNFIQKQLVNFDINDVAIPLQAIPAMRWSIEGKGTLVNDARIRLLDCLLYLEHIGEIKFIELLPSRVVIDATNLLPIEYSRDNSRILTCGKLSLDESKCKLIWNGIEYKNIPIGNKTIQMLILLLRTPNEVVKYETIIKEAEIVSNLSFSPQVAQQYKNQLFEDLVKAGIPETTAKQIREMIKSVNKIGYRITSN